MEYLLKDSWAFAEPWGPLHPPEGHVLPGHSWVPRICEVLSLRGWLHSGWGLRWRWHGRRLRCGAQVQSALGWPAGCPPLEQDNTHIEHEKDQCASCCGCHRQEGPHTEAGSSACCVAGLPGDGRFRSTRGDCGHDNLSDLRVRGGNVAQSVFPLESFITRGQRGCQLLPSGSATW